MIEFNGIANLKILLESSDQKDSEMYKQVDLLERYLVQVCNELNDSNVTLNVPEWYEIRENPQKFPNIQENNREKT